MTWQSGGGGSSIAGLSSDNANGIIVDGAINSGHGNATVIPTRQNIYGALTVNGTIASDIDGDESFASVTGRNKDGSVVSLAADSFSQTGVFSRRGTSNGHAWRNAVVTIEDASDDTTESSYVLEVMRGNNTIIGFDEFGMWASLPYHTSGGLGLFNHAAPAAASSITGALSAVTDPATKAVLTSVIAALIADGGATNNTT